MPPYRLDNRLVVGIASSALFDLDESDGVFREKGEDGYRVYQRANLDNTLRPGVAFSFIRRLLSLNDLNPEDDPLVEVIILSRNDPDTGLRVMRSIKTHGLPISRAVFTQGRAPYRFMPALHMSLFLSADGNDVREAVAAGLPAGRVLGSAVADDPEDRELRIAFDFDGVLADDESERVFQRNGLAEFRAHETMNVATPHDAGPLRDFLREINKLQRREEERRRENGDYTIRVHVSVVTARNAPTHERAMTSLNNWGVTVNDAFFLGGIDKSSIMDVLRPHIFFDDQEAHLRGTSRTTPSVHIPFGVVNQGESARPSPERT
ncbi:MULTISPECIES: 5'-nucleotidase [Streptomyces]|uniref:5'-nucleotidase n=1 Tax=Streptomyces griseiscabiei TaxID=2993540 RepID=A0ABU4LB81_9ACTN|nr:MULTISPECIES: 5'-nucleotidase [Streptomyces]MBZ3904098.1 5'-nucleotidase [Streptomyces griseiscabiei]MDX2913024.1 5'-nucleotidase [Streptomyces griseiscabiei]